MVVYHKGRAIERCIINIYYYVVIDVELLIKLRLNKRWKFNSESSICTVCFEICTNSACSSWCWIIDAPQPLPEKHSLKRFDRFNQEFVKTRMVALQTFLQRIADHPVLSFNKNVFTFLTAKQWVCLTVSLFLLSHPSLFLFLSLSLSLCQVVFNCFNYYFDW